MNFKKISLLILLVLALLIFAACEKEPQKPVDTTVYYTLSFNFNNGQEAYTVRAERGTLVSPPISPERENYIFNGWKYNGKIWDFSDEKIYSDMSFTAQWIDASSIFSYSVNGDSTITVTEYRGSLTEIRIPEIISGLTVTAIGNGVFEDFSSYSVNIITVPKTVTTIGEAAFKGCATTPIKVLGTIESLGESAFDGCEKLDSISFAEGISSLPFRALASCSSLKEIVLPSTLTSIGEDAFSGCSSLKTLVIMSSELEVGDSAFAGCESLVTIFFGGSKAEWENVLSLVSDGGNGNDSLKHANVYFYSEEKPEAEGEFWYFNDKGQPRCW